jgi:hypothetical protein
MNPSSHPSGLYTGSRPSSSRSERTAGGGFKLLAGPRQGGVNVAKRIGNDPSLVRDGRTDERGEGPRR